MTQAIIPTLVEKGIQAVSVGVNPGTSPPAVPNLFRWQFEEKEVLGTWHAGAISFITNTSFTDFLFQILDYTMKNLKK